MLDAIARRLCRPVLVSTAVLALCASSGLAQEGSRNGGDTTMNEGPSQGGAWSPDWSDADIAEYAEKLIGVWRTATPIETSGEGGTSVDVMMRIHAVPVEGMSDTLYIESYRTDDLVNPYRQALGQFYRRRGDIRLRTFELAIQETQIGAIAGLGSVPDLFPEVASSDAIATMDMTLYPTGQGFTGRTPYPYPTAKGGAVEMTSSIEVRGDTLTTVERGYAADGSIAWGADEEGKYEFQRIDDPFRVERRDNGLVIVDMQVPEGEEVGDGDRLHVHYAGWLVDTSRFDTSRQEGRDVFIFNYPPRLIQGWNEGLNGVTSGTVRKLIVPGDLGYGVRGQPRAGIPGDATLYFTMEILLVEKPEAAAESGMAEPAEDAGAGEE